MDCEWTVHIYNGGDHPMKKLIALLLSLAMLISCTAALADAAEEAPVDYQTAHYQFRNLTGDTIVVMSLTDNKTGEVIPLLEEGENLLEDQILYFSFGVDGSETKEDLEHRYNLYFMTADGYTADFETLSFEDVLIDLLAADALTGATPIKFNAKMYQVGNYKIINKTDKTLESVTITENADANNNSTVYPKIGKDAFAFANFVIDPDHEASHALTIEFAFEDGTSCSFGTLSIEEAALILTPDTITGATPFTFGPIDAE